MALLGSLATLRTQTARMDLFAAAFAYLDELFRSGSPAHKRLRGIAAGDSEKIELTGGAFALEQVYETKVRADGFFESHRKFIDVQVVCEGEELMDVADMARLTVRRPYNDERDVIIYEDCPDASGLRVHAGEAAMFFPEDAHMPGLRAGATPGLVRKTVIKVPTGR